MCKDSFLPIELATSMRSCLQANDVEQQLWKSCFYKPLEEFRSRLRAAQQAAQGVTQLAGATPEEAEEQVRIDAGS